MVLISTMFHVYKDSDFTGSISLVLVFIAFTIFLLAVYLNTKFTKMNQSLFYREELFNSLCSTIDDVFLIYQVNKQVIEYISPNIDRAFGISGSAFKKNPFILLKHTNSEFKRSIIELFTTKIINANHEIECQMHNPKNKELSWFIIRIYPVLNRQTVIRYIISISDLTKEKQTQQVLKDALMNTQKANEAKKDFLSHMSHEIRTPINAIIGMTQVATKYLEDKSKVESCLDKISEASKNLISMVNNILDMAKIDSSKLIISREPFSLKELLFNFSSMINTQAELNQLKFELVMSNISNDTLLGDSLRLSQVLGNCISNAIKFTPPGGRVTLAVTELNHCQDKSLFRFTISDNGKGMGKEYIDRIFVPFEQEDSSITQKYGGSGLGMSITKNLVNLMEGSIQVNSKLGEGTTITIDLPINIPKESASQEHQRTREHSFPDYDFSGHRILVVEDNKINLEITCEFLKFTQVCVDTATCGSDAIKLFEASPPSYYDIILMDIQMPGMNGYETTKLLRKSSHPDASHICIIAMSADSYIEDVAAALKSGMNYHITKPIDAANFFQLLNKIFNEATLDGLL